MNAPAAVRKQRKIDEATGRATIKCHYDYDMLDDLEKGARELRRMDWTVKVRLINQARRALELEAQLKGTSL